jgi:hypothetical protein
MNKNTLTEKKGGVIRASGLDALKNPVGKSYQPANRISIYERNGEG